jgi:DNA helicase-2/ATP-dependent DNA helicase PcrA
LLPYYENKDGENIFLYFANDYFDEANWVVTKIKSLIQGQYFLSDIVILYRNNFQALPIEQKLISNSIKYYIFNNIGFLKRKIIQNLLAYLKLFTYRNNEAVNRILLLEKNIGIKFIEKLQSEAGSQEQNIINYLIDLNSNEPQLFLKKYQKLLP